MNVYEIGPFRLNADRLTLEIEGRPVALGRKVIETLLALAERPGEELSKDELLNRIWPEGFVEEANLTQNVYTLRKLFRGQGCSDPIETLPRFGYRFTAPVRCVAPVRRFSPRLAAGLASAAFIAACFALAATATWGSRAAAPGLSEKGARLYQIGEYYWNLRTRDGVTKSLEYFGQVVDADPKSPVGYAALADANITVGDYCYGTHRPAVYFARAAQYAQQALTLDPNSAQAHAALGFLALRRNDKTLAVAELQRAIAGSPSYAPAHEWYGIALLDSGHLKNGLAQLKIAADLDPLSVSTVAWLGSAAYASRRFDEALVYARQALELSPTRTDARLTVALLKQGRTVLAREEQRMRRHGTSVENALNAIAPMRAQ
jgi:DNA-binding winged helix-turn-helix (wHTH) protein/Flp pilus assembly protein TadD